MQNLLSVEMIVVVVDMEVVDTDEIHLQEDEAVVAVASVVGLVDHTILNSVCSLITFPLVAVGRILKITSVKQVK